MVKDFLGTEIKIGERGLRVDAQGHSKQFVKVTIKEIDESRKYGDSVGIISDRNTKIGWTYPFRIIVQDSINIKL